MNWLTPRNSLQGALIYGAGDSAAALLGGEFSLYRLLGMLLLGGTLYAVEIPRYFAWIERRLRPSTIWHQLARALLAQAFFNPLWVARHIAFIKCFSGQFDAIGWPLFAIGLESFLHIVPLALCANYGIQNFIPLRWRFAASATFSACMAFYYALSEVLFG